MEDIQAIRLIRNGHRDYFEELITNHEKTLYKYCYHLTSNQSEAQDLFQDVWIKVLDRIDQYNESYSFKNWLLSIATNLFKDNYRKRKRWSKKMLNPKTNESHEILMNNIQDNQKTDTTVIQSETEQYIHQSVNKLKDHYRYVIILFYFEDLSINEISTILSVAEGTVKSRLNQAKKLLKKDLEVYGIG